jgi:CHASE2 domain-containing sensor protein
MLIRLQRASTLIAGLWVGSFLSVGFLVTPLLFATLDDRQLAGSIAGTLFKLQANLSVLVCLLLLCSSYFLLRSGLRQFRVTQAILLMMLACISCAVFIIIPWMSSLKDQAMLVGSSVMDSEWANTFDRLHHISSGIYTFQSLLGIVLVWRLTKS